MNNFITTIKLFYILQLLTGMYKMIKDHSLRAVFLFGWTIALVSEIGTIDEVRLRFENATVFLCT